MTPVTTFAGKTVALFGLGGSGLVTAKALVAGGARVLADDDREASKANAREQGIEVGDLKTADWSGFSALILTPGVPLTHPRPHWSVDLAALAGIEVIGDIELFSRERQKLDPQAPLIAITGTNGKSTTTALITHILRQAHREVAMGGNIGTAILALDPPSRGRIHVVECSSYQIDLAPSLRPSVGMMLNLSPDHLDRHGTMENYAAIKQRLVAASDLAVIGVDDRMSSAMADAVEGQGVRVARVSTRRAVADGVYAEGTRILAASAGAAEPVADIAGIGSLRGRHNAENAAAAFAACRAVGLDAAEIARGLASFPGLPHRMEEVGRLGRVLFVNDSKATNADAAARALSSFEAIHWIAGGQAKEGGIAPLAEFFPHVAKAYLVGEAAPDFAATLGETVPHVVSGEIARALEQASRDAAGSAAAQPVVLLSPACASFDQFRSFEHRGDVFRALVKDLLAKTGRTS